MPPSPERPLTGGCGCGAVRFAVTAPFTTAGYCHCTRCQRRTGTGSSINALAPAAAFAITQGEDELGTWRPPNGNPKWFCASCGGHVFSGELGARDGIVAVRCGALDGDPGIRPQWRQWLDSAPAWDPIPDDGLARFAGPRQA